MRIELNNVLSGELSGINREIVKSRSAIIQLSSLHHATLFSAFQFSRNLTTNIVAQSARVYNMRAFQLKGVKGRQNISHGTTNEIPIGSRIQEDRQGAFGNLAILIIGCRFWCTTLTLSGD